MRTPTARRRTSRAFGPWIVALAAWIGPRDRARAEPPPDPLPAGSTTEVEDRLRRLEALNARLLDRLDRDREESDRRYRDLEGRYVDLQRRVGGARPAPAPTTSPDRPEGPAPTSAPEGGTRASHLGRPGELGKASSAPEFPLVARLAEGFQLASRDDEFDLRFHILDQTDAKFFSPNNRTFGKSGLYIPRVRLYLEGRMTRYWDYEVSLQRSLEGTWDLLDGNLNFHPSDAFQVKFGRQLVPYSYEWFDHLEQYFIVPERALFALNFGLSRQAGLMAWGNAREGRLDYALGGFNGHLTGLADNNPNQEAVGYLNFRPFFGRPGFPALQHLNVGASGTIGEVARNEDPLPLRTSVQAAENDEAANDASSVFLAFRDGSAYRGGRRFAAVHLAYYFKSLSFESEWNLGAFDMTGPDSTRKVEVSAGGFHTTLGYFLTGEQITRRTTVEPLRPFQPVRGRWGPGAFEPFVRYSQLNLGESVFSGGLADGRLWARDASLVDLGVNWYPNRWMKFYFTWQHAMFGSPILVDEARGTFGRDSNLFWARCQIYF